MTESIPRKPLFPPLCPVNIVTAKSVACGGELLRFSQTPDRVSQMSSPFTRRNCQWSSSPSDRRPELYAPCTTEILDTTQLRSECPMNRAASISTKNPRTFAS